MIVELLNSKFNSLDEKIDYVKETGDKTYQQAVKTNGRVNQHDKDIELLNRNILTALRGLHELKEKHNSCTMNNGIYQNDVKASKLLGYAFKNTRNAVISIILVGLAINILSHIDLITIIKEQWTKLIGL